MSSPLPASLSQLQSQGVPAVQSGRVVVAIVRLQLAPCSGWLVTLAAGVVGASCLPIARATVSGRTRAQAVQAARALATRYAQALGAGQVPAPLVASACHS